MAEGAALVDGLTLHRVDPYGKHLFYRFGSPKPEKATNVHVHLGLFGKISRFADPAPEPRDTVRMRLAGGGFSFDLTGPTDCRVIDFAEEASIRRRLGPDPLRADADPDLAWQRITKRTSSIGEALMDQKVMAGVGNVYRAEALFVNGIHPNRPSNTLTRDEFDAVWATVCRMLAAGVKDQRMITVDRSELALLGIPPKQLRGKEGVYVYKKELCTRCQTPVSRWDLAGRWAYACPTCQVA
jgi:endonuclease VIII